MDPTTNSSLLASFTAASAYTGPVVGTLGVIFTVYAIVKYRGHIYKVYSDINEVLTDAKELYGSYRKSVETSRNIEEMKEKRRIFNDDSVDLRTRTEAGLSLCEAISKADIKLSAEEHATLEFQTKFLSIIKNAYNKNEANMKNDLLNGAS